MLYYPNHAYLGHALEHANSAIFFLWSTFQTKINRKAFSPNAA